MHHTIRHSIRIVITESWRVSWEDQDTLPVNLAAPGDGSHIITWAEGQEPPTTIILRRQSDGSGWRAESGDS